MVTFDGVLNIIVPIGVLIVFSYMLIKPFFEPFGKIYHWIRGLFGEKEEQVSKQQIYYE